MQSTTIVPWAAFVFPKPQLDMRWRRTPEALVSSLSDQTVAPDKEHHVQCTGGVGVPQEVHQQVDDGGGHVRELDCAGVNGLHRSWHAMCCGHSALPAFRARGQRGHGWPAGEVTRLCLSARRHFKLDVIGVNGLDSTLHVLED